MGELILMNRATMLEKLREHYKNGDINAMKRGLSLGAFFLLDEDKVKIQKAIQHLESTGLTSNEINLFNKAKDILQ